MMLDVVVVTLIVGGRAVGHGNCRSASLSAGSPQLNNLLYAFHRPHFLYLNLSTAYALLQLQISSNR